MARNSVESFGAGGGGEGDTSSISLKRLRGIRSLAPVPPFSASDVFWLAPRPSFVILLCLFLAVALVYPNAFSLAWLSLLLAGLLLPATHFTDLLPGALILSWVVQEGGIRASKNQVFCIFENSPSMLEISMFVLLAGVFQMLSRFSSSKIVVVNLFPRLCCHKETSR